MTRNMSGTGLDLSVLAQVSLAASAAAQVRSGMKSPDNLWQVSQVKFKRTSFASARLFGTQCCGNQSGPYQQAQVSLAASRAAAQVRSRMKSLE